MSSLPSNTLLRTQALAGYRRLLRARTKLFAGDTHALSESHKAIRSEFLKNRHIPGPPEQVAALSAEYLKMIDEAEDMMLHGIGRGELNRERNVVEVKIGEEHESRMDNETLTHMEPITKETGRRLDGKTVVPNVEVTKSSGNNDEKKR